MVKRCVVQDCSLEGDYSYFFNFPDDSQLLNKWVSRLPILNLTSLNFKEAVICEHHFNPKELKDGLGFSKELANGAVPEYFPGNEEIDANICRFCLRKLGQDKIAIDDITRFVYFIFLFFR
jgi:hypothetical protein